MDKLKETCQLDREAQDRIISFSVPFMIWMIAQQQFRYVAGAGPLRFFAD